MPRFDVVGFGVAACDYLTVLDRFPGADEKARSEEFLIEGGGTIGTALVAVARLGLAAGWAGSLGEDEWGRFILASLEKEEIDTRLAHQTRGARSPFAFCVSSPPHRNVFSVRPTAPPYVMGPGEIDAILDTRFLHIDGSEEASLEITTEAKKRGVGVSVDFHRRRDSTEQLLACADVAVVSENFASDSFSGRPPLEAVRELYRPDMQLAAITRGAAGVVACDADGVFELPATTVDVVDSTGAGDVFHGALLVGLLTGKSGRRALELAAHVAGLSCRGLGGRAAIPRRDELGSEWL